MLGGISLTEASKGRPRWQGSLSEARQGRLSEATGEVDGPAPMHLRPFIDATFLRYSISGDTTATHPGISEICPCRLLLIYLVTVGIFC